ncbi:sensor histidine kinase [Lentzea sp. DG1S-22]|uniref:sensor histidine kinase n=1 Tax=Lentzea sp. DG1S-22 TaxID=3108822 RepID=UPI002E7935B8|nr:sensor histidine kinase [Lentzea sp. DG1S-22]WVH82850.1 sensor histidine kinase [Lentzea sp. DG1S-22]
MRKLLRPTWADLLLALIATALTLANQVGYLGADLTLADLSLAALTVAPIAIRHVVPVTSLCVILGSSVVYAFLGHGAVGNLGLGVVIGVFTVANVRSSRIAAMMAATSALCLLVPEYVGEVTLKWSEAVQAVLVLFVAWMVGESSKKWARRAEEAAEREGRAAAEERVRIARELHDIVAHHMSVISLQAGVAEYTLASAPATARTAISAVSESCRQGLTEMRRLLDVLRVEDETEFPDVQLASPGLDALPGLVDRTRDAGLTVELVVRGTPRVLPPGQDLCAYRVAQESLTNVLKHAGPAAVEVVLDYRAHELMLTITDDGASGPPSVKAKSHGIQGMRERAELYGGVLDAGHRSHRGFQVVLRLPIPDQS